MPLDSAATGSGRPLIGLAELKSRADAKGIILVGSRALREQVAAALPDIVAVAGSADGWDLTPLAGRKVVAEREDIARAAAAAGAIVKILDVDLADAAERGALTMGWLRGNLRDLPMAAAPAPSPPAPVAAPIDAGPLATPSGYAVPPWFSDDGLAIVFTRRHGHEFRYVAPWARWMRWDGTRWQFDRTLSVFELARTICREAAADLAMSKERAGAELASAKKVAAVERLARSDPAHAATVDQWDADPWLLNTPGGVVNLRTGELRPHDPCDHLTKSTAATPGGECPTWRRFLEEITCGDMELAAFLQRMTGYSLTGTVREHALFFLFGTGGNGKGTFLNTLTAVLGDYATIASIETFTATPTDRHPTDLAMLRGARLVVSQETEEGRHWAESRIKALTGGDPITARFMRQDFFTYIPQFKLVIAGNHRPGLRNVDEAMRRRLHLVPFLRTFQDDEKDPELGDELRAEFPGILEWAIHGCLDWQRMGLRPPQAVRDACADYFATEDALGTWIAERCHQGPTDEATTAELYANWKEWAERSGEHIGSMKRFSQNLAARGFKPKLVSKARLAGFERIRLVYQ